MDGYALLITVVALAPAALMALATTSACMSRAHPAAVWRRLGCLAGLALLASLTTLGLQLGLPASAMQHRGLPAGLGLGLAAAWVAVLVQLLGTVIAVFSARYLEGEPGQRRYAAALAAVLSAVHLLLLADHWLLLIAAWAAVGAAMHALLCFYPERPFAQLAAHKKRLADRAADLLLLVAAALAWSEAGSGHLPDLWRHLAGGSVSVGMQVSAVCLVLAVILRAALLPVHGWLIQVMEAPTPVSALLHAGVVNLGGFVLIRFAPLIEASAAARWLLVVFGLGTALMAGLVMLTRISIKVRLAWSTVAQMGFMALECGLGLYTLAMLHLLGHSLYKAHAFLSAGSVVRQSRIALMRDMDPVSGASLLGAPVFAGLLIWSVQQLLPSPAWPWWWNALLACAWAPLLWQSAGSPAAFHTRASRLAAGIGMVSLLTLLAGLLHQLPLGATDQPDHALGVVAAAGMALIYLVLTLLIIRAPVLEGWRRWSYAGFFLDELTTRLALWTPPYRRGRSSPMPGRT